MTVARGMGGEGSVGCVANGHMTVGRWGKGGRGRGRGGNWEGEERRGGWVGGGPGKGGWGRGRGREGGGGGGGGERRGPVEPAQHKSRGLVALKKIEIRPGPAR